MTIHFKHHGNSLGEVTLDGDDVLDAQIYAATAMRLPFSSVAARAEEDGLEVLIFNDEDADRTITSWLLVL